MPSAFTHGFAALAGGKIFTGGNMPVRFWVLAVVCSVLPDADAIGFSLGVPYGSFWGHRGFTHSLFFAAPVALIVVTAFFRSHVAGSPGRAAALFLFFFAITASHGLLDMLTSGGLGVALFAPFDNARHFFPWRPIRVSPIGVSSFFSERGLRIMASELLWVWLPFGAAALPATVARRIGRRRRGGGSGRR